MMQRLDSAAVNAALPLATPERLRALRQRLGWSQTDLARALDVRLNTINRWESPEGIPHPGLVGLALERLEQILPEVEADLLRQRIAQLEDSTAGDRRRTL